MYTICRQIALMRVFPTAIVLTTKCHFHVKRTYASIRGLVVRTITPGKTRISAILHFSADMENAKDKTLNQVYIFNDSPS